MTRGEVIGLIAGDLKKVEKAIGAEAVCSVQAVNAIHQHLQSGGGKRLRPSLLLLCAGLAGYRGESAVRLGAVVEIIHTATLIHDDVIDEAKVRRGQPSTNSQWGNQTSVLSGDWLYMQAFKLALQERNFYVLDLLIALTQRMVEGELMQMEWVGRTDLTEQEHFSLIDRKTACLFSVCARLGSVLGGLDSQREQNLASYGWKVGVAFQLIDDVLDFTASEETLGKPVGNDLREGKVTLPLILTLQRCTAEERRMVETVVEERSFQRVPLEDVLGLLHKYDAIETVRRRAFQLAEEAVAKISPFPENDYKRALTAVTEWIVDRDN